MYAIVRVLVKVSAINPNTVKISFSTELESLSSDDLAVANKDSGEKQYVKSVELSEDKTSATVVFYDDLTSEEVYTVTLGESSFDYEYVLTDVAEVIAEDQVIEAGVATEIEYQVTDANGVDITEDTVVKFVSPSSSVNEDTGVVTLPAGTSTTVEVVYDNGEKVVESDSITVTAEAAKAVEVSNWTVGTTTSVDFTADDYEQNTVAFSDDVADFLNVEFLNQFGDVYSPANVVFESLDTNIAVVDKNTGEIQAFNTGSLPVKVSIVEDGKVAFTKTVEVSVKAERMASDIELEKTSLTLSTLDTVGVDIEASVLDQYNKEFTSTITPDAGDSGLVVTYADDKVNVKAGTAEPGTYTVDLKAGEDVVEELTVVVKAPGAFAEYEVRGTVETLDKKDTETTELSVVAVDSNDLFIQDETASTTVSVLDKDDVEVATSTTLDSSALAVGTYTVEVTLGDKVIETFTFDVVDTTELPDVTFTSSTLEGTVAGDLIALVNSNVEISDEDATVTALSFVSANDAVVSDEDNTLAAGETSIFVESFEVDLDGDVATTNDVVTVDLDNPEKLNVVVE